MRVCFSIYIYIPINNHMYEYWYVELYFGSMCDVILCDVCTCVCVCVYQCLNLYMSARMRVHFFFFKSVRLCIYFRGVCAEESPLC